MEKPANGPTATPILPEPRLVREVGGRRLAAGGWRSTFAAPCLSARRSGDRVLDPGRQSPYILGVSEFGVCILEEKVPVRFPAHLVFFLSFPALAPAADSPGRSRLNAKSADLAETIRSLVEKRSAPGWQVGVAIIDHQEKVRAAIDSDRPLSPASNQKILVVGAALGTLGPDFKYETRLAASAPPKGGEIRDLVVAGD